MACQCLCRAAQAPCKEEALLGFGEPKTAHSPQEEGREWVSLYIYRMMPVNPFQGPSCLHFGTSPFPPVLLFPKPRVGSDHTTSPIPFIPSGCRGDHDHISAGPGGQIRIHPHRSGRGWGRGAPPEDGHCHGECGLAPGPSPGQPGAPRAAHSPCRMPPWGV